MNNGLLFADAQLVGTYAYSAAVPHSDDKIELHVTYDPDEGASAGRGLNLILQVADTGGTPAAADWLTVGEVATTAGTLTFTSRTLEMLTTGAGTKRYALWSETVSGRFFRVGIREASVSADFGNVSVHYHTRKA